MNYFLDFICLVMTKCLYLFQENVFIRFILRFRERMKKNIILLILFSLLLGACVREIFIADNRHEPAISRLIKAPGAESASAHQIACRFALRVDVHPADPVGFRAVWTREPEFSGGEPFPRSGFRPSGPEEARQIAFGFAVGDSLKGGIYFQPRLDFGRGSRQSGAEKCDAVAVNDLRIDQGEQDGQVRFGIGWATGIEFRWGRFYVAVDGDWDLFGGWR